MPQLYELGPMPSKNTLTAIQLALWDNGSKIRRTGTGRKSNGQRFKLIIEAYDQPLATLNKRLYRFKRNISLRSANPFLSLIDKQKGKGTIEADYHKALGDTVTGIDLDQRDDYMFGQIWENNDGWRFFPFQYIVVKMPKGDENPVVMIFNGDDVIVADRMNDHFASGRITHTTYINLTD